MRPANLLSALCAAMAVALLVSPRIAHALGSFLVAPPAEVVERSPAFLYANMPVSEALRQLDARGVLYQREAPVGRLLQPIRLTGRLHGVQIRSALPAEERTTSHFELCDPRLALVLDDFSAMLERRGIVELIHYTMYRPSVGYPTAPRGLAVPAGLLPAARSRAASTEPHARDSHRQGAPVAHGPRGPGLHRPAPLAHPAPARSRRSAADDRPVQNLPQSRHPDGLAIDVGALVTSSGEVLRVANDFHGRIGTATCGARASVPNAAKATMLWAIACEVEATRLFTYVLTPNFDVRHQDHFHMEIKPEVRWFMVH